ncbi:hypothetical protein [Streptomyces sp. NBC_01306]|uniref:hypothetical protein n=1 Tax=Streptomyces sp. NBC_01306 TaxID=2903819 RepID=UPI002252BDF6|nr:hypothetical protein [Streptomyces sp. NBC_01306]MCX4724623.1 hypothetical protein [Streptomyces sp. NBC_01306]
MARRTPAIAAALAVSAALLLTACGGSNNDASKDKIKGADEGTKSPSASTSAATGDGRPDVSVPADLHLNFSFDKPADAAKAAAMGDAENYIRALKHGIVKQNPEDPAYKFYSYPVAARYAKSQIQAWVKGDWTPTGTDRYFNAEANSVGTSKSVLVTFCRNQAKSYSKSVKTGKINDVGESLDSYQKYSLLMAPSTTDGKVWKAQQIEVQGRVKECRG